MFNILNVIPRRNWKQCYVNFWGANKAHYCLGENVQYSECNTPREIGNHGYVKFGGVNKAHYCLGENVQYSKCNTQEKLETMFV